jgi:hypothetical protein
MFGGLVGAADAAGFGVLLAGAGACVRLVGATWKVVNAVKVGGNSNGSGEWRGRVETILDTVVKVQDHSIAELGELRRATDRMNAVADGTGQALERITTLLDAHDRRTVEAAPAMQVAARQLNALYHKGFPR